MNETRIVAFDPTSRGFGYVCFKEGMELLDWGHSSVKPRNDEALLNVVAAQIAWYNPKVVVLEDWTHKKSRRRKRVKNLLADLADFVLSANCEVECYAPHEIARCFAPEGKITKHEIAEIIADMYPELGPRLPPKRKIWQSEDERTSFFDAAALALTYFWHADEALIQDSLDELDNDITM